MRRILPAVRRSPVLQFGLSGLLATLVVAVVTLLVSRAIGTNEAIRDAKTLTRVVGEGIVAPNLTPAVFTGDPAALGRLDGIVRSRVLREGIVRVKVWDPDGTIVYSDEARLIGERFDLNDEERDAL